MGWVGGHWPSAVGATCTGLWQGLKEVGPRSLLLAAFPLLLSTNWATVFPYMPAPQGTYLLLEKLRYAVYRRLLRKVHAVHGELEPEKRAQIPLAQFQAALAMQVSQQSTRS